MMPHPHESTHEKSEELSELSKVTPRKPFKAQQGALWSIVGVVAVMLVISITFHPKKQKEKEAAIAKAQEYKHELESNLNAIQRMREEAKLQPSAAREEGDQASAAAGTSTSIAVSEEEIEKRRQRLLLEQQRQMQAVQTYQMRVHAPTSLMSGESSHASSAQSGGKESGGTVIAGTGANQNFVNQSTGVETVSATKLSHPDFTVASGELIQAVLETPINSDLPGMLRAITSQPVYAYTGNMAIIPAGSRLIGQYSSGIVQGQSRILVVWNRVILPDGTSAQVNSPGTDSQGISGQGADSINRHFWARFGEASLLSIIGAGAANVGVSSNSEYKSSSAYRSDVAQSFSDAANDSLDSTASMQPTLIVHQGAQINVFVARDLDFSWALREKS